MTKKKREIGKRLAVIVACAVRDHEMDINTSSCLLDQAFYIAGEIGGVRMVKMIGDAVFYKEG